MRCRWVAHTTSGPGCADRDSPGQRASLAASPLRRHCGLERSAHLSDWRLTTLFVVARERAEAHWTPAPTCITVLLFMPTSGHVAERVVDARRLHHRISSHWTVPTHIEDRRNPKAFPQGRASCQTADGLAGEPCHSYRASWASATAPLGLAFWIFRSVRLLRVVCRWLLETSPEGNYTLYIRYLVYTLF